MHQCTEVADAMLELERATFEEGKKCLEDDLDQALACNDVARRGFRQ